MATRPSLAVLMDPLKASAGEGSTIAMLAALGVVANLSRPGDLARDGRVRAAAPLEVAARQVWFRTGDPCAELAPASRC
jgi:hypothetical protein